MGKCSGCDWRIIGVSGDTVMCLRCAEVRGTETLLKEQQAEIKKLRDKYGMYRESPVRKVRR